MKSIFDQWGIYDNRHTSTTRLWQTTTCVIALAFLEQHGNEIGRAGGIQGRDQGSEQVRQPIYRDATAEWHRYENFLDPLKDALGAVVSAYPNAPAAWTQR